MLDTITFGCASIVGVISALFIFKTSNMVHAMVAFALVAVAISGLMLVLQLPLLALLQLFIMVGGVSTYLFVGASSEELSKFKHANLPLLVALTIIIAAPLIYGVAAGAAGTSSNLFSTSALQSSIASDLPLFYLIAILLFGIGISSILVMKKLVAQK